MASDEYLHLSLLEGGVRALSEALALLDQQRAKAAPQRDAYVVARTVDAAHLAADRLLKHVVAAIDPYLLLANPRPELLRNIRRAFTHDKAVSIFATNVRFDSLDTLATAKLLAEVLNPPLDELAHANLTAALKPVNTLRNHVQHGELFGDSDRILGDVRRLLGELFAVMTSISVEAVERLAAIDGQAASRLRAYKEEADAAWMVLTDYLEKHPPLVVPFKLYVTAMPDGSAAVSMTSRDITGNSLRLSAVARGESASGMFGLVLGPDDPQQRAALRGRRSLAFRAGIGRALSRALESPPPAREGLRPLVPPRFADLSPVEAEPRAAETHLRALEDSRLTIRDVSGSLSLFLEKFASKQYLSAAARVREAVASFTAGETRGSISGALGPEMVTEREPPGVSFSGWLEHGSEYRIADGHPELEIPPGSTWRIFKGEIMLQLAAVLR